LLSRYAGTLSLNPDILRLRLGRSRPVGWCEPDAWEWRAFFSPQETPEVGQMSDFMSSMQMWHSTRTQVVEMGRISMTRQKEEGDGKRTPARL
jgi:hypothetical protein